MNFLRNHLTTQNHQTFYTIARGLVSNHEVIYTTNKIYFHYLFQQIPQVVPYKFVYQDFHARRR